MNATLSLAVPALGWALIGFLWQGALVGLATAVALMLLRNARPQVRYAVCCAALALCLALPVAALLDGLHADPSMDVLPAARFVQLSDAPVPVVPATTAAATWQSALQGRLPWIVALWSIGAALLAARMALGMMWVVRAGRENGQAHPRWQRRLDRLAEKLGIECKVRLRVVADLATPVAAGCFKPVVLVPAALIANMPLDLLEALLAHELAHVRRHDYLVNLIQSAIEALLFYHPVVWWLSRRIRVEREQIADDLAAQAIGEPRRLALALHELDLFQLAQRRNGETEDSFAVSLIPAANGGHLMSRIQRLIRPNQHALSWNIALPIIGLTVACMAVYAHDGAAASTGTKPFVTVGALTSQAVRPQALAPVIASALAPAAAALNAAHAPVLASEATTSSNMLRLTEPSGDHEDSYAVVRPGREGVSMSGDSRDLPAIESARRTVQGEFIWARHDGKTYVVQDPALVASAVEAWKPAEALDQQMEALDEQMKIPDQKMEELDRQMEHLDNDDAPENAAMEKYDAQMEALDRQVEAISSKMEDVGDKMEDAGAGMRESLQHQMDALQAQMEPLNAQIGKLSAAIEQQGKQIQAAHEPMEQLGKRMEEESKPMEALGKQMEALGKQEEQLSHDADRRIRALIDEAIRTGKAQPVDNVRQE